MQVNGRDYRTVWMKNSSVFMIEQNKLPFVFEIKEHKTYKETAEAIRNMTIRGAPAIGAAAGYAMAQAFLESNGNTAYMIEAKRFIEATRPTAQNLFYATNRVFNSIDPVKEGHAIADESSAECEAIGRYGEALIKDGMKLATQCNAGWLACVDWGTAPAAMFMSHRNGKKIFIYVHETGPRGQGGKLTAWEFYNEGIPHIIIPDSATAYYMKKGMIDMMIVGADRVAANGDAANKIGTLKCAIIAKEYGVPFYIAAPLSTFDMDCATGEHIPIEMRSEREVTHKLGIDEQARLQEVQIYNPGSRAENPAFDVTDAKYIAGIITEQGIVKPDREEIAKLFSDRKH